MRLVSPAKGRCRVHQRPLDRDALHSLWTSVECRRTRTQEALIRDDSVTDSHYCSRLSRPVVLRAIAMANTGMLPLLLVGLALGMFFIRFLVRRFWP